MQAKSAAQQYLSQQSQTPQRQPPTQSHNIHIQHLPPQQQRTVPTKSKSQGEDEDSESDAEESHVRLEG
jgi:hypothetical protein